MTRLLLLLLLAVAACTPQPDPPVAPPTSGTPPTDSAPAPDTPFASEDDYRQQRERAVAALEAAVRTEAGTVEMCRVAATSEQACGGPTTFVVYSAEAPDADEVERLAAALVALDIKANAQFEWVSTCMAYAAPTPRLVQGRCVE